MEKLETEKEKEEEQRKNRMTRRTYPLFRSALTKQKFPNYNKLAKTKQK